MLNDQTNSEHWNTNLFIAIFQFCLLFTKCSKGHLLFCILIKIFEAHKCFILVNVDDTILTTNF